MGYSRLEPGRELEVREYISFQRGRDGFCELIECSVDELLERKAESIVREKELCQRIDAAVEVWSKQAQQTQQYMKALEYVKTPPTPHTSNRWTVNEYGNHEMSNMVYRFSWREYEHTEWDRTLEKSVPKSWELTWSVTFNTPHNPDYSGDGWKIAGQDRKIFRDRASMEKYLQGRGIHPVIIRYCLDNKLLFESADYHNAMFVGYDKDGKARYGALRSTVSSYKGELTGSDKHFSFFLEGKPNAEHIHVFESAIDLLSFATLTLLAGRDWKSETYLSLAGVFQTKRENVVPVALSRFLDEHPSVRKIHLHLDNDAVGRGAVKGIVGGLQGKYQVYDEPPSHGKDVNDELKIRVGLMRERKEQERT